MVRNAQLAYKVLYVLYHSWMKLSPWTMASIQEAVGSNLSLWQCQIYLRPLCRQMAWEDLGHMVISTMLYRGCVHFRNKQQSGASQLSLHDDKLSPQIPIAAHIDAML